MVRQYPTDNDIGLQREVEVEGAGVWRRLLLAERIEQFHQDIAAVMDTEAKGAPQAFLQQYQLLLREAETILGRESPIVKTPDSQDLPRFR